MVEWSGRWRLKLNVSKYETCLFTTDTSETTWRPEVRIDGTTIPHNPNPTFLGVTYDTQLTLTKNMEGWSRGSTMPPRRGRPGSPYPTSRNWREPSCERQEWSPATCGLRRGWWCSGRRVWRSWERGPRQPAWLCTTGGGARGGRPEKRRGQGGRSAEDHQAMLEEEVSGKRGRSLAGGDGHQRPNPGWAAATMEDGGSRQDPKSTDLKRGDRGPAAPSCPERCGGADGYGYHHLYRRLSRRRGGRPPQERWQAPSLQKLWPSRRPSDGWGAQPSERSLLSSRAASPSRRHWRETRGGGRQDRRPQGDPKGTGRESVPCVGPGPLRSPGQRESWLKTERGRSHASGGCGAGPGNQKSWRNEEELPEQKANNIKRPPGWEKGEAGGDSVEGGQGEPEPLQGEPPPSAETVEGDGEGREEN